MTKEFLEAKGALSIIGALYFVFVILSCGPKNSVTEKDSTDAESANDARGRLGNGSSVGSKMNQCRYPLDIGTVLDPRRPGLYQTVLTSQIDANCAQSRNARITLRSKQALILSGRYSCKTGSLFGEQVCAVPMSEIVSQQRTSISIPVTADDALKASDVEASVELN